MHFQATQLNKHKKKIITVLFKYMLKFFSLWDEGGRQIPLGHNTDPGVAML